MEKQQLKFIGVDDWSRPIYLWIEKKLYFGSVNVLLKNHDKREDLIKEAKEKVHEVDICYFGTSFGCEPMGCPISAKKIELTYEETR